MKKINILSLVILLTYSGEIFAQQISEKEKKKIQKEQLAKAKAMDPIALKKMMDEYPNMSSQIKSLESKVSGLESDVASKDARISSLESDLSAANNKIQELEAAAQNNSTSNSGTSSSSGGSSSSGTKTAKSSGGSVPGLIYKIQIGAFRNNDLTQYFDNNPNFSGDVDEDGTKKYTIGVFTEYWEADTFKKYMRHMGVKDAWIVPYYNGKRVSMKDAREGVLN